MTSVPRIPLRKIVEHTGYDIADDATYLSQADTKEVVEYLYYYAACSYEETPGRDRPN